MNIVNCTPHAVVLIDPATVTYNPKSRHYSPKGEGYSVLAEYAPSGILPRCQQVEEEVPNKDFSFPLIRMSFGEVQDLPEPKEGTYLLVSALVAQAVPDRQDLIIPAHMVRDDNGRIIGCTTFAVV